MTVLNTIKSTLLISMMTLSLVGCDVTEDELDQIEDENNITDEVVLQTVSGKTADGYLVGAKVCVDVNNNSVCDEGEPSGLSTEGGAFVIDTIDESIDLATSRVIVEIIANQTIDEDHPDEVIDKPYTLTSPPGQSGFVSPITTIVDAVMANDDSVTVEEATAKIKVSLGLSVDSDVDLLGDYVAGTSDTESASAPDYQKLHIVAQVVTNVISQSLAEISEGDASLADADSFSNTLNAVVSNVEEKLENLADVIDNVIENAEDGADLSELVLNSDEVTFVADESTLDAAEVNEKIIEITEEKSATSSDVETLLTEGEGFFFLESYSDNYWDGQVCKAEFEFSYDQFKIVDDIGQNAFWFFNSETGMFEADIEEMEDDQFSFYTLGDNSWQLSTEGTPDVVAFSDDGQTLTVTFPGQGSRTIIAKQIELAEKPLSDVKRVDESWGQQMMAASQFPAGALMYSLSMEQIDDSYMVPYFDCHNEDQGEEKSEDEAINTDENCNHIWLEYSHEDTSDAEKETDENDDGTGDIEEDFTYDNRALTIEDLINVDWDGDIESLVMFYAPFAHDLLMALVSDDETNNYSLFFQRNYECYEGMVDEAGNVIDCEMYIEKGTASWSLSEMNSQSLLHLELTRDIEMDGDFSAVFLTEVDGYVRLGLFLAAGTEWEDDYALNEVAIESVVDGFTAPTGSQELAKEHCGIFDDQYNDGGEHHDDPLEQGAPPELISDATNTALLSGSTYIMEFVDSTNSESETIFLQFTNDEKVRGVINEYKVEVDPSGSEFDHKKEEAFDGTWVIDDSGQLLLNFEQQQETDEGQVVTHFDWVLFKVDGEISDSLTLIDNTSQSEDNGDVLSFTKLEPFTLMSSVIIERTDENDEVCKLDLTFDGENEEGTGSVDTTSCADIKEEGITNFNWFIGDVGQIIIEIVEDDDSVNNSIEFFQLGESSMYLVSQGVDENTDEDGSVHLHHFADIEKWTLVTQ